MLCYHLEWSMNKLDIPFQRPNYSNEASNNKNINLLYLELLVVQVLERLELTRVKHNILAKVHKGNYSRDQEELVAKTALELQKSSSRIVHSSEWMNIDGLLYL